jgi:asparagine synthase (glutamine-hydrolysing)
VCGIVAIIRSTPTPTLSALADRMLETIAHRGPDDHQLMAFDDSGPVAPGAPACVVIGTRRLAVQDLSAAGRQPMATEDGRTWIAFNGEVYDFPERRAEMEAEGHVFTSRGDTEVVLRWLVTRGLTGLDELDGMFGMVVLDLERRRLHAIRDRFGIKPLYTWTSPGGDLVLASEIKQFTVHPEWQARLNRPRAWDFLRRGVIDHTDETLFDGVGQVPAGHFLELDLDAAPRGIVRRRWFTLTPTDRTDVEAPIELRERLDQAVTARLRADVTVGSCLSGGLDSSTIVALMARKHSDVLTFTARTGEGAADEWPFALEVANRAGVSPNAVEVRAEHALDDLASLVWTQDEPFASPSIVAQNELFRAARAAGVTVMLDGQGADEQLGGYHAFFPVLVAEEFRRCRLLSGLRALAAIRRLHGGSIGSRLIEAAVTQLRVPLKARVRSFTGGSGLFSARNLGPPPVDPFDRLDGRRRGVAAFALDQMDHVSLPMLLHWEDRNSMAHGVEARVPFLSHHVVAFIAGLPTSDKIDAGMTKVVLRRAIEGLVPESVRTRIDKVAFETPEERWLVATAGGRAALETALEAVATILEPGAAESLRRMQRGENPYDRVLWRVICFGAWIKRFDVSL